MGQPEEEIRKLEWGQLIGKIVMWFGFISVTALAMLAVENQNKKLSWKQALLKVFVAYCFGGAGAIASESLHLGWKSFLVVSGMTMLGQSFAVFVIKNRDTFWDAVIGKLISGWKKKKEDNNTNP